MVDLSKTIIAKSDQLNADDLTAGPMTITITRAQQGSADQPVFLFYEGSGKKSFRPCKSMRRVLVDIWGMDANEFVGKSMTLYRDPKVQYGGEAVGGVRISHMSHLNETKQVSLLVKQGRRGLYTVKPLRVQVQTPAEQVEHSQQSNEPAGDPAAEWADTIIAEIDGLNQMKDIEALTSSKNYVNRMDRLRNGRPELNDNVMAAVNAALERADPFAVPA